MSNEVKDIYGNKLLPEVIEHRFEEEQLKFIALLDYFAVIAPDVNQLVLTAKVLIAMQPGVTRWIQDNSAKCTE